MKVVFSPESENVGVFLRQKKALTQNAFKVC